MDIVIGPDRDGFSRVTLWRSRAEAMADAGARTAAGWIVGFLLVVSPLPGQSHLGAGILFLVNTAMFAGFSLRYRQPIRFGARGVRVGRSTIPWSSVRWIVPVMPGQITLGLDGRGLLGRGRRVLHFPLRKKDQSILDGIADELRLDWGWRGGPASDVQPDGCVTA